MLLTENQLRNLIKNSLIKKMINENEENSNKQEFVKNVLNILNMCKNKIKDIMWTDEKIEEQKDALIVHFNYHNDTAAELYKKQVTIERLKKKFYNSPLEILLTNLMNNKEILNPLNKVNPVDQSKDTRAPLINLINDESKHKEIVDRLIKTIAYRRKKNPAGKYRSVDYTSADAAKNLKDAFKDVGM